MTRTGFEWENCTMLVIVATALLIAVLMGGSDEASGETWNVDDDDDSPGFGITALTVGGGDFLSGVEDFLNGLGPMGIAGMIVILVVVVMFVLAIMNWKDLIFVDLITTDWGNIEKKLIHWDEYKILFLSIGMLTTLGIAAWVIEFMQPRFGFFHSFVAVIAVLIILFVATFLKTRRSSSDDIWKFLAWAIGLLSITGIASIVLNYRYGEWNLFEKCDHGLHVIALSAVVTVLALFVAIVFYFYLIKPKIMLQIGWTVQLGSRKIQLFPTWLFVLIGLSSISANVYGIMKGFGIATEGNTVENIFYHLDRVFGYEVTVPQTNFKIYLWYVFLLISSFMAVYMAYGLTYTFHMWIKELHNSGTYFFVLLTGLSIVFAFEFMLQNVEVTVQGSAISIVTIMTGVKIIGWCWALSCTKEREIMRRKWIIQLMVAIKGGKIKNKKKIVKIMAEALKICEHVQQGEAAGVLGNIGNDEAVEALLKVVEDDDSDVTVRKQVVAALYSIGNEKATQHLEALMENSDIGEIACVDVESIRRKTAGVVCSVEQEELTDQLGVQAEYLSPSGIEFILVPAGTFTMGSEEDPNATPHQVTISKPFFMGKYPVTQRQWRMVMGDDPSVFTGDDRPVEKVSWYDCQKFLQKLNEMERTDKYRLPTEAEWEYTCRAGSTTKYCFGDKDKELKRYAWYKENSDFTTWPVGLKKPNDWGLHDMHGNIREWCQDWCDHYPTGPVTDPTGPSSARGRANRGGGWAVSNPEGCASAYRYSSDPELRGIGHGFRLAKSL